MIAAPIAWLRGNWRLVAVTALVLALGVQTLRLAWLQAEVAEDKAAQAEAIRKLHDKAEALSNELVIEQAKAMGKAAEKETIYVDRVRRIPVAPGEDDAARTERMRAGTAGVRDILCGSAPTPTWCGPAGR